MSDHDVRDNDEPAGGEEGAFTKRTVQINPNVIANYWEKDKKPLFYYKRWRGLLLRLEDYEFHRHYNFLEASPSSDFLDVIDSIRGQERESIDQDEVEVIDRQVRLEFRQLAKRAMEDFDSLSIEEKSQYRWAHLKDIHPQERLNLVLNGWADVEQKRAIEVFSVDTKNKSDDRRYERTFNRININLREAEEDAVGKLLHWTEDLRRYDDDDPGHDYLIAEIYLKKGSLERLEHEIRESGGKAPLSLFVKAHLFQYEVEEGLAEPYHYQQYSMVYDEPCSIFLESIHLGVKPNAKTDEDKLNHLVDENEREQSPNLDEEFPERFPGATSDRDPEFQQGLFSVVSNMDVSLRHIKLALWVLVVLLLFALFT